MIWGSANGVGEVHISEGCLLPQTTISNYICGFAEKKYLVELSASARRETDSRLIHALFSTSATESRGLNMGGTIGLLAE